MTTHYRTTDTWRGAKCETLADILEPGLVCVFVGLNPSNVSVERGHYLQGTLGRLFLAMLVTYGILPDPCDRFHDETFLENGFGLTDLAKCPSPRANALTRDDIATGRAILRHKIEQHQPKIVCSIYKKTLESLTGRKYTRRFGLLPDTIGDTKLFAAPFPYRPAEDVRTYFPQLRDLIEEARAELQTESEAEAPTEMQPEPSV